MDPDHAAEVVILDEAQLLIHVWNVDLLLDAGGWVDQPRDITEIEKTLFSLRK